MDESSLRLEPNKGRIINTPLVSCIGSEKRSKTIFGFMALNGNDVAMLSDRSKAKDAVSFLELVRMENPKHPILIILDNARIHVARTLREKARELDLA